MLFDWERNRYLAYECKRLGVIQADGRRSLATDYVTEGMMRFMTEQYAEGLPLGCMLGFVMDGDIEFALDRVTASIEGHRPLGLIKGLTTVPSLQDIQRFVTRHLRPAGTQVELRHALLSYRSTR